MAYKMLELVHETDNNLLIWQIHFAGMMSNQKRPIVYFPDAEIKVVIIPAEDFIILCEISSQYLFRERYGRNPRRQRKISSFFGVNQYERYSDSFHSSKVIIQVDQITYHQFLRFHRPILF